MNFRYRLAQFMSGRYFRYGIDFLTKILVIVCFVLSTVNIFVGSIILYLIETMLLFWMIYRLFSKNINKRQSENLKCVNYVNKFKSIINLRRRMQNDKQTHIYKKCPHCSVMLRLPRKTGEHTVNCPRCRNDFKVKVK